MSATALQARYRYPVSDVSWGAEERASAIGCLDRQETTMGEMVAQFEREFGEALGARAVMVNSGSSADLLGMLWSLNRSRVDLWPADGLPEILCPVVTWPTQVWSAVLAGYRVRLVDVDPETLNVSLPHLEAAATGANVRALGIVHLMGNPVDMGRVRAIASERRLAVLEDCCEGLGGRWRGQQVGTFGESAAFSFFHSHHMSTMEGGMVVVHTEEAERRVRAMRSHGWAKGARSTETREVWDRRYQFIDLGMNVRPTELQGAFGVEQLRKLPRMAGRRLARWGQWSDMLGRWRQFVDLPQVHAEAEPAWFAVPIMVREDAPFTRATFVEFCEEWGIETRPIMSGNFAAQEAVRLWGDRISVATGSEDLAGARAVESRGFYLGIHASAGSDTAAAVDAVEGFFKRW